jgi:hypothetical protein
VISRFQAKAAEISAKNVVSMTSCHRSGIGLGNLALNDCGSLPKEAEWLRP